ncbi:MAG: hypothetical protein IPH97_04470 [Ignavibacteriales bacterium]|nr:hypothetical protein [Ignavibacteriales bacterium]
MKTQLIPYTLIFLILSFSNVSYPQNDSLNFLNYEIRTDGYDIVKIAEKDLKLTSLQNTNSELGIRIWYFPMRLSKLMLTSFELINNEWKGKLFLYSFNGIDSSVSKFISTDIVPKSGWPRLLDKIQRYGIFVLPDHTKLGLDVNQVNDGISFLVEVVDGEKYRLYSYFNPEYFASESFENGCMSKIISLLNEEFNLEKAYRDYKPKY